MSSSLQWYSKQRMFIVWCRRNGCRSLRTLLTYLAYSVSLLLLLSVVSSIVIFHIAFQQLQVSNFRVIQNKVEEKCLNTKHSTKLKFLIIGALALNAEYVYTMYWYKTAVCVKYLSWFDTVIFSVYAALIFDINGPVFMEWYLQQPSMVLVTRTLAIEFQWCRH